MLDLDKVTLRRGHDARFLNIDYDGTEIGHVKFDGKGDVGELRRSRGDPTVRSSNCLPGAPERSDR